MYLTQAEYTAYGGGEMSVAEYSRLEYAARKKVDHATQQRVQGMAAAPEAVKRLMYELIQIIQAAGEAQAIAEPALASFSTDGYSESYAKPATAESAEAGAAALILDYLSGETDDEGVPLLYLGVV